MIDSSSLPQLLVHWDPEVLETRLFSSAILLVALVAVRYFGVRTLRTASFESPEDRRRWIVQLKNGVFMVLVGGLVVVWAQELRAFALGLAALAVAMVVATREFILCFVGGILKASTRPFDVGDRIEVGSFRGDVFDHNFLTTTLQEVGPDHTSQQYTGRNIAVPNSQFLSHPITVEKLSKPFIVHSFKVVVKPEANWQLHEQALLRSVRTHSQPYLEQARAYLAQRCKREAIELPSSEPRVSIDLSHVEYLSLTVRLPVPSRHRVRIQQAILHDYLEAVRTSEIRPAEKRAPLAAA